MDKQEVKSFPRFNFSPQRFLWWFLEKRLMHIPTYLFIFFYFQIYTIRTMHYTLRHRMQLCLKE